MYTGWRAEQLWKQRSHIGEAAETRVPLCLLSEVAVSQTGEDELWDAPLWNHTNNRKTGPFLREMVVSGARVLPSRVAWCHAGSFVRNCNPAVVEGHTLVAKKPLVPGGYRFEFVRYRTTLKQNQCFQTLNMNKLRINSALFFHELALVAQFFDLQCAVI